MAAALALARRGQSGAAAEVDDHERLCSTGGLGQVLALVAQADDGAVTTLKPSTLDGHLPRPSRSEVHHGHEHAALAHRRGSQSGC